LANYRYSTLVSYIKSIMLIYRDIFKSRLSSELFCWGPEDLLSDHPVNDKLPNYCDYLTDTQVSEDCLVPLSIWASNKAK